VGSHRQDNRGNRLEEWSGVDYHKVAVDREALDSSTDIEGSQTHPVREELGVRSSVRHTVNLGRHSHHRHRSHGNLVQSLFPGYSDNLVVTARIHPSWDSNDHKPDSLDNLA